MPTAKRINVSVPADLFGRIENSRGREPRSSWAVRAFEQLLLVEERLPIAVAQAPSPPVKPRQRRPPAPQFNRATRLG